MALLCSGVTPLARHPSGSHHQTYILLTLAHPDFTDMIAFAQTFQIAWPNMLVHLALEAREDLSSGKRQCVKGRELATYSLALS